ncbi:MAG: hypothetical protein WAM82_33665 [Thermoanaerobaculia bacterium]
MTLQLSRRIGSSVLGASLAILLLYGAPPAEAQRSGSGLSRKHAWEWTTDERLLQRFDPEAMEARAAERAAEKRVFLKRFPKAAGSLAEPEAAASSSQTLDTIEGSKTPELFLPSELFDNLLNTGFPPEGRLSGESRRIIEDRAVPLGFGSDLWKRLEKAAAPYLKLQREEEGRAETRPSRFHPANGPEIDGDAVSRCRARAAAFSAAKADFGEEPFLRLLYEAVAPGLSRTYIVDQGTERHLSSLRSLEGGCP